MAASPSHFNVTLFNYAWRDIYEQNTHADFSVKLTQPVDLGSTSNWEVVDCAISCYLPHMGDALALIYCNLISPQFVGGSTVRYMLTFVCPLLICQHEFRKVYYVPVEQRKFQDVRIEFLSSEGLHIHFEDSTTPTKGVLYFGKNYKWWSIKCGAGISNRTFITMHLLKVYYSNEVGRGFAPVIGPVYSATHYLQRGHGIGNFFRQSLSLSPASPGARHCILVAKS